jgi:hypothetical protein
MLKYPVVLFQMLSPVWETLSILAIVDKVKPRLVSVSSPLASFFILKFIQLLTTNSKPILSSRLCVATVEDMEFMALLSTTLVYSTMMTV